jgi:hypothetical protein
VFVSSCAVIRPCAWHPCEGRAGDGLDEIPTASVAPPTTAETTAVNAALDHLGYSGPREIRLLLTIDYS